jgi:heptosyltransferase-2
MQPGVNGSPTTAFLAMAGLGDLVFSLPSIAALGRAGHEVVLVTRPSLAGLGSRAPGVTRVFLWDKRGADAGPLGTWRAAQRLRATCAPEVVVAPHPSIRSGLFARLTGAALRVGWGPIGYTRRVPRGPRFVADALALVRALGIDAEATTTPGPSLPKVDWPRPPGEWPVGALALLPGAAFATKRWPGAHFAALAERLVAMGHPVLFAGGADEATLVPPVLGTSRAFGLPLDELAALLASCRLVVGGDTGTLHLARALGVPAHALFGPTSAARLPDDAARIDHRVDGLACRPCSAHGPRVCPRAHHACMRTLEPRTVLQGLQASGAV